MEIKLSARVEAGLQVIAALEDKAVESLIEAICKEYVESYVDTARATRSVRQNPLKWICLVFSRKGKLNRRRKLRRFPMKQWSGLKNRAGGFHWCRLTLKS